MTTPRVVAGLLVFSVLFSSSAFALRETSTAEKDGSTRAGLEQALLTDGSAASAVLPPVILPPRSTPSTLPLPLAQRLRQSVEKVQERVSEAKNDLQIWNTTRGAWGRIRRVLSQFNDPMTERLIRNRINQAARVFVLHGIDPRPWLTHGLPAAAGTLTPPELTLAIALAEEEILARPRDLMQTAWTDLPAIATALSSTGHAERLSVGLNLAIQLERDGISSDDLLRYYLLAVSRASPTEEIFTSNLKNLESLLRTFYPRQNTAEFRRTIAFVSRKLNPEQFAVALEISAALAEQSINPLFMLQRIIPAMAGIPQPVEQFKDRLDRLVEWLSQVEGVPLVIDRATRQSNNRTEIVTTFRTGREPRRLNITEGLAQALPVVVRLSTSGEDYDANFSAMTRLVNAALKINRQDPSANPNTILNLIASSQLSPEQFFAFLNWSADLSEIGVDPGLLPWRDVGGNPRMSARHLTPEQMRTATAWARQLQEESGILPSSLPWNALPVLAQYSPEPFIFSLQLDALANLAQRLHAKGFEARQIVEAALPDIVRSAQNFEEFDQNLAALAQALDPMPSDPAIAQAMVIGLKFISDNEATAGHFQADLQIVADLTRQLNEREVIAGNRISETGRLEEMFAQAMRISRAGYQVELEGPTHTMRSFDFDGRPISEPGTVLSWGNKGGWVPLLTQIEVVRGAPIDVALPARVPQLAYAQAGMEEWGRRAASWMTGLLCISPGYRYFSRVVKPATLEIVELSADAGMEEGIEQREEVAQQMLRNLDPNSQGIFVQSDGERVNILVPVREQYKWPSRDGYQSIFAAHPDLLPKAITNLPNEKITYIELNNSPEEAAYLLTGNKRADAIFLDIDIVGDDLEVWLPEEVLDTPTVVLTRQDSPREADAAMQMQYLGLLVEAANSLQNRILVVARVDWVTIQGRQYLLVQA